jgi:hypothetical protein
MTRNQQLTRLKGELMQSRRKMRKLDKIRWPAERIVRIVDAAYVREAQRFDKIRTKIIATENGS